MAEQSRLSRGATGLISFAPWILYGVASGFNHWRAASAGGLILCIITLAAMRYRSSSIKLMDWTVLAFFVIASVMMLGLRSTAFPVYGAVVVWSCFAVAAWSSIRPRSSVHRSLRSRDRAAPILGASRFHQAQSADDAGMVRIDDRQYRLRCDRCHRGWQPDQATTEFCTADGTVGPGIRFQRPFSGALSCAIRFSDPRRKCASRLARQ